MGLLKDIKELVGINTGDEDDERDEELEQETTSKALSKRQKWKQKKLMNLDMKIIVQFLLIQNNLKIVKIATYIEKEK